MAQEITYYDAKFLRGSGWKKSNKGQTLWLDEGEFLGKVQAKNTRSGKEFYVEVWRSAVVGFYGNVAFFGYFEKSQAALDAIKKVMAGQEVTEKHNKNQKSWS